MHFFAHPKGRILLPLVTILALVSAFTLSVVSRGPDTHASAPVSKFQGTHSMITQSQNSHYDLHGTSQPSSKSGARPRALLEPGSKSGRNSDPTTLTHPPHAPGLQVDRNLAGVLHNFPGLNSVDSFKVNGFLLEPPDQGLCVGYLVGHKVVGEIINDVVAFYTPNGELFSNKENLNAFFAEPPTEFVSDPRCYFDTSTQTFFFTVLAIDSFSPIKNHVDIAVLHENLNEFIARVDVTFPHNQAGGCPCLGDQPKLGIDKHNLYISVDQFNSTLTLETGAALIAVSKADLLMGSHEIDEAMFLNLSLLGIGITGLQPAITNGNAESEFLLNSFPYANEAQTKFIQVTNKLGLWSVNDPENVAQESRPELNATVITSEPYAFPVPAHTTNGKSLATFTNDDRMQQVQYINGHLWGALDSAVIVGSDTRKVDGIAWFEIKPSVDNDQVSGSPTDQGYVAAAGKYLLYPAIETNYQGTTGIAFSLTSPTLNPSTGYVVRKSGQEGFSDIHITALGSGPDIGFTCALGFPQECRWGDYSAAALDPNGQDIWMAAEDIVPQVATQVVPGVGTFHTNWGTRVWDVNGN